MTLHIENPEADRLARELAEQTGETVEGVVLAALRERLAALQQKEADTERMVEEAMAIGRHFSSLPVLDARTADEILGYDEHGLPT